MSNGKKPWTDVDKRLEGDRIQVGERSVRPTARLTGKRIDPGSGQGAASALMAQLKPVEVVVRDNGEEHTVVITETVSEPLRGIVMAGMAVAFGCVAVMFLARRVAKGSLKHHQKGAV